MSIVLVKANKGGVGKSWITLQLGHGLALKNKKVLILTSDSQNNILDFAGVSSTNVSIDKWLKNESAELTKLRSNLYYLSLTSPYLTAEEEIKLETFINVAKVQFDYILIDSTPVLGLDKKFVEIADKIIIPTFLDSVTMGSITTLMDTIDPLTKVKAIIPNRVGRTKLEKDYYTYLKEIIPEQIYLSVPINQLATISKLIDTSNTIWESKNKQARNLQNVFTEILEVISDE